MMAPRPYEPGEEGSPGLPSGAPTFDPDSFLSDLLSIHASLYRDAFRDYWRTADAAAPAHLEDEAWQAAKLVCSLAKAFVEASISATPTPPFDPAGIVRALDRNRDEYDELGWLFQQAIEVELSRVLSKELGKLRQRGRELQSVLMSVPRRRARAYLLGVAPCYLRGMRAEGLVMCWAILDTALREYMEDEGAPVDADVLDRARRIDAARRRAARPATPDEATLRRAVEDLAVVLNRLSPPMPAGRRPRAPRAAAPGSDRDHRYYDRDGLLSDLLSMLAFFYRLDFHEYWGTSAAAAPTHLKDHEWKAAKLACSLANRLVAAARSPKGPAPTLQPRDTPGMPDGPQRPDVLESSLFSRAVEVELAPEFTAELGKMRDRSLELLSIWMSAAGEGARSRFSRLASCYLRGMHAEGLVMCRAVLEAALEDSVSDDVVRTDGAQEPVDPEDRLAGLERGSVLSPDGLDRARRVRAAGGYALQPEPQARPDLHQSVEDVAFVLNELERAGLLRDPAW